MGTNTAEAPAALTEEEQPEVIEPTEPETPIVEDGEPGEDGEQQEATEFEVVLDGADGSQPDTQRGIRKRINKLNNKVADAQDQASHADEALAVEREKNKLLQLALEQSHQAEVPLPPDPSDYDDGARDPNYIRSLNEYNQPMIAAEVHRQTANLAPVQVETIDPSLVKRQTKHYERASELGAKDFDEVEDKAISILGNEVVNHLINNSDESHLVLYYLGKNPGQAEEIAGLIKTNPVKATLQLGQLSAKLSVKPRANSEPTPDPDDELKGGSPSAGQSNKHQRIVDDARKKAQENGNIKLVLEAKKAAREAGVTVT